MRIDNIGNKQSIFVGNQQQNKKDEDDVVGGIQKQITNTQEQIKQLSENKEMTAEEKVNRKKELQQQIEDLNKQLSERQMEIKKQEQAEKEEKMKEKQGGAKQEQEGTQNIDQATMQNFIAAGNALSNASSLGETRTRLNGEKKNLASQIETDAAKGIDTTKKRESLSDMEQRISNITEQIGKELGKVSGEMKKDNVKKKEETDSTEKNEETEEIEKEENNVNSSDPRHGNPAINILR